MTRAKKSTACLLSIFTRTLETKKRKRRKQRRPISTKRNTLAKKMKKEDLMSSTLERIPTQIISI